MTKVERIRNLKSSMDEALQELGHDPRLVWLQGYVKNEVDLWARGADIDLEAIEAIETIAKDLNHEKVEAVMVSFRIFQQYELEAQRDDLEARDDISIVMGVEDPYGALVMEQQIAPVAQGLIPIDTSRRGEASYTKRGDMYVVDDGGGKFGQFATIAWSGRDGGFSVQIYEKLTYVDLYLNETVADENHMWGSYMLEDKCYEDDRSEYGATVDGRIMTVEGLQKTLSQFGISWPKGLSDDISAEV